MMNRHILPLVTLALAVLVLVDRINHVRETAGKAPAGDSAGASELVTKTAARAGAPAVASTPLVVGTPTLDRLARLAARQELVRVGSEAYLDSLLATTDSVVRRWPDRAGPLHVAIVEGGVVGYDPRMAAFVRHALESWERSEAGVRFVVVLDTADADVVVRWIDRFEYDRAGQTDLTWDRLGRVRHAAISLAIRTNTGALLPDPSLLAVAIHETGHAIGLPHSADSADVMFPATRGATLSLRDRRTAQLLYGLQPGSVRDSLAP